MIALHDERHTPLHLGDTIGSGGEGIVYALAEDPTLAAKVYARPLASAQVAKLAAMVGAVDVPLRGVAAWPTGLLYAGARPVGFTMPRLVAQRPIHDLIGPRTRQERFPDATWTFLIHTALNLARAFSVLHERGIVVGDVNSNNVVVGRDSTARLIDCDSFQFRAGGALFPCCVGVPDYQPPELQACDLARVERLPEHDLFGLAVMIFQLLFVGKHPFAGVLPPGVPGTGAIGANVAAKRFFYHRDARRRGLRPPPGSPALSAVTPELATLFTRAFLGEPHARPNAEVWQAALRDLETRTVRCAKDPAHRHARGAGCPWCELDRSGLRYFLTPGADAGDAAPGDGRWERVSHAEVERAWNEIAAVRAPATVPHALVPVRTYATTPLRRWSAARRYAYVAGGAALASLCSAAIAHRLIALVPVLLLAGIVCAAAGRPDAREAMARLWRREADARRAFAVDADAWTREARALRFHAERARLAKVRERLRESERRVDAEIAKLRTRLAREACRRYLATQPIATDARTNLSFARAGLRTLADVTREHVRDLPGISRRDRRALLRRRDDVEYAFYRRGGLPSDPRAEHDIRIRARRAWAADLARLRRGPATLRALANDIEARRPDLERRARASAEILWQARADARVPALFYKTWT